MNADNEDTWICGLCCYNIECLKSKDLQEKCFASYCEDILKDNDDVIK